MSKDNNHYNVIRYICFAIIIALFIGVPLFAQTHDSVATARLAVLSETFSDDNIKEVRSLINFDADVNVRNKYGVTPLYSASQNGHTEIVKLLLAANADVSAAETIHDVTPLSIALERDNTEVVKLLMAANADVNATDCYGVTALWVASWRGHTEVVSVLLAANADVNAFRK